MPRTRRKPLPNATVKLEFNHAMIYVRDRDRALRFYAGELGFRLVEKLPGYARLRSPGGRTTIALHELGEGVRSVRSEGIRLYFETRHLERFCARLARRGVRFKQMPQRMPWGWMHAYLDDPDGHEISLYWAGAKRFRKSW